MTRYSSVGIRTANGILLAVQHELMLYTKSLKFLFLGGLVMWLLLEASFFIVVNHFVAPQLQKFRKPVPTDMPPIEFFTRIFSVMDKLPSYSIEDYVEGFFLGQKLRNIYVENLKSFLSWAMFGKHLATLDEWENHRVQEVLDLALQRYPQLQVCPPGFNPNIKHVAMTVEPVHHIHRPLITYFTVVGSEVIFNQCILLSAGFYYLEAEGITYWIRPGSSSCSLPPLLFLHGISPGWSIYYRLVQRLGCNADRTIILADLDAVKMKSMFFFMPSMVQFTSSICRILDRHNVSKVSIVGHSFGSITAAWLLKLCPERVAHLTLLDPVSILLFLPDAAKKLLYSVSKTWMEYLLYTLVAKELTVSYSLHRSFVWHQNILWMEDVPPQIGVVVGIAMDDEITNPQLQTAYLKQCQVERTELASSSQIQVGSIEVVCWEKFSHGQIMTAANELKHLCEKVMASESKCILQRVCASNENQRIENVPDS
jgi:hypothetical protein